jgi:hypothetical protein
VGAAPPRRSGEDRARGQVAAPYDEPVRLYLYTHDSGGTIVSREKIELPQLPEPGSVLRPPVCTADCFVTRAVPASIEGTGDLRIEGTIYADLMKPLS